MYVCICKAVTENQLETAIKEGLCTRRQLFECFGVGGDCGKCKKDIHVMLSGKVLEKLSTASNEKAFGTGSFDETENNCFQRDT
ncbi:MAG: (2Fe-2S)-binding protein [Gammaproteobacteria bacterium]